MKRAYLPSTHYTVPSFVTNCGSLITKGFTNTQGSITTIASVLDAYISRKRQDRPACNRHQDVIFTKIIIKLYNKWS